MRKHLSIIIIILSLVMALIAPALESFAAAALKAPTKVTVTTTKKVPVISWAKVANAKSYVLYRKTKTDTDWVKVGVTKKTTLTDSKVKVDAGQQVDYMVRAARKTGGKSLGRESASVTWSSPAKCPYEMTSLPVVDIKINPDEVSGSKDYSKTKISFYSPDGSFCAVDLKTGIRLRGNASRGFAKKSYKVKLDEKINLYGLAQGKEKIWVLVANHCDQTLLRNQTALKLQNSLNGKLWSPDCISVEVYMNGEYQGVYMLAEEIKVSENRVNVSESNPDELDTGYLVQFTAYAEDPTFCLDASYEIVSDLSSDEEIAEQQRRYIEDYISQCLEALRSGDEKKCKKLMDLDSLVACYLTEEISMNIDAAWDSFYLYKDAGGKLTFGPMWDFDLAFGNDGRISEYDDEKSYEGFHVALAQGSLNGSSSGDWFAVAMCSGWFREMVVKAWNANSKTITALPKTVKAYVKQGQDAFERNLEKWPLTGDQINQEPEVIRAFTSYKQNADYLVSWITKRINWLEGEINNGVFATEDGWNYAIPEEKHNEGNSFPNDGDEAYKNFLSAYSDISGLIDISSLEAPDGCWDDYERVENLFDRTDAKYCVDEYDRDEGLTVTFALSEAAALKGYLLYTANDTAENPDRNPISWILYGSKDNKTWTVIDEVADGRSALKAENHAGTVFAVDKPGKYKYYRFVFQAEQIVQFGELLLGK